MSKLNRIIRKKSVVSFSVLVLLLTVFALTNQNIVKSDTAQNVDTPIIEVITGDHVSAMYTDTVTSFENLIDENTLIVVVDVKDNYEHSAGLSMISDVKVQEVISGKCENKIEILQLKGDHVLEVGAQYLLFLKEQPDSKNLYHPSGGDQGIAKIQDNKIIIENDLLIESYLKFASDSNTKSNLTISGEFETTSSETNDVIKIIDKIKEKKKK